MGCAASTPARLIPVINEPAPAPPSSQFLEIQSQLRIGESSAPAAASPADVAAFTVDTAHAGSALDFDVESKNVLFILGAAAVSALPRLTDAGGPGSRKGELTDILVAEYNARLFTPDMLAAPMAAMAEQLNISLLVHGSASLRR